MKKHTGPIIAVILLLLPLLYVGTYYALVVPFWGSAHYRFGGQASTQIFWPMEQVDRKMRPGAWQVNLWAPQWSESAPSAHVFLCPTHWPSEQRDPTVIAED